MGYWYGEYGDAAPDMFDVAEDRDAAEARDDAMMRHDEPAMRPTGMVLPTAYFYKCRCETAWATIRELGDTPPPDSCPGCRKEVSPS